MGINQIWCVIPIIFVSMASRHNARLFDIYGVRSPFLGEVHAIPPSCFVPSSVYQTPPCNTGSLSVYRWWDHCAMPPVSPAIIHLAGVALVGILVSGGQSHDISLWSILSLGNRSINVEMIYKLQVFDINWCLITLIIYVQTLKRLLGELTRGYDTSV